MLKGDVFNKQYFPSNTFALFIDTFLDSKNGIVNGYKNNMSLTNTSNQITISSGALCVRGRFIREDSSTTLDVLYSNTTYCKLVVEIDLDKINTVSELNQLKYKIISSETDYPNLTQSNIIMTESGIYQYELARFICNSSGISNFTDMRTFLDFNSIYTEIRNHINTIDSQAFVPIGSGIDFYGTVAPENYMFADGSAISRTTYDVLFSIIGTTYGAGDGSTTFNLPDKRERVSVMYKEGSTNGTNQQTLNRMGAHGGEFKHTLTISELPRHRLPLNANTMEAYGGDWWLQVNSTAVGINVGRRADAANPQSWYWFTDYVGENVAHNIMQPYLVCNYIIKVK